MLQFPGPFPPGTEFPPLNPGESLFRFLMAYLLALGAASLCLPRPWFVVIFRLAFPFMHEDLDQKD
jgi:hypothetical protein